jgi:hypothetical protein
MDRWSSGRVGLLGGPGVRRPGVVGQTPVRGLPDRAGRGGPHASSRRPGSMGRRAAGPQHRLVAAARKLTELVFYGLRHGHIRRLPAAAPRTPAA